MGSLGSWRWELTHTMAGHTFALVTYRGSVALLGHTELLLEGNPSVVAVVLLADHTFALAAYQAARLALG